MQYILVNPAGLKTTDSLDLERAIRLMKVSIPKLEPILLVKSAADYYIISGHDEAYVHLQRHMHPFAKVLQSDEDVREYNQGLAREHETLAGLIDDSIRANQRNQENGRCTVADYSGFLLSHGQRPPTFTVIDFH